MSLSSNGPYPKIWKVVPVERDLNLAATGSLRSFREKGYALVSLLAVMTVIALFALAAAPSIRQQAQREREREAIFRGEQLAEAIRLYHLYQIQTGRPAGMAALPTSMDQLLEGVPRGTKKRQVLRPSAAIDPLTDSGEWRLIRPGGPEMADFVRDIMLYSENIRPKTNDRQLAGVEGFMAPIVIPGSGFGLSGPSSIDANYSGPFIGAASRSESNSVIYYYGIGRHDGWIFTPIFR